MGTWTSGSTQYGSGWRIGQALFLPAAGNRFSSNGSLNNRGFSGFYWSSTESGSNAQNLYFLSSDVLMSTNNRTNGFSLRCVAAFTIDQTRGCF